MCCARSSARITCSVKNLEPIVIFRSGALWQEESTQAMLSATHKQLNRCTGWRMSRYPQPTFNKSQEKISNNGKKSGRNGSRQKQRVIHHGDSSKDERPKSARANCG